MREIPIEVLGVNLDIPFVPPRTLRQADLEEFAAWICDPENGLGLRPDQVRLKKWDELFGYELVAQFFGDNGLITRTPDRIKVGVRNARTSGDWELIRRLLVRFYNHMNFDPKSVTTVSAHVHSRLGSEEEVEAYFAEFPQNAEASRPALFSYVKIADWESHIRVLIEQSNAFPNALFIAWDTQFPNTQDWETFIGTLTTVMDNSAHVFGVTLAPLP